MEKYIRHILNSTADAIFILEKDGGIKIFNEAANRIIFQFTGKNVADFSNLVQIVPEFRKAPVTAVIAGTAIGKKYDYELLYPCNLWLQVIMFPILDEENKVAEVCVTLRDITERKKAEEEMRISEQRYHSLFESMREGVVFQSLEENKSVANSSAASILGITQRGLILDGMLSPLLRWINEKGEPVSIFDTFCVDVKRGKSMHDIILGVYKGTEIVWLSINAEPIRGHHGEGGCVFTFMDISESLKYRDELSLLSQVMRETSNIVVITDNKEKIVWANNSFSRSSGYSLDEAKNKRPGDLLKGPNKNVSEIQKIRSAIKSGSPVQGEILNYSKTGKEYWTNYNIQPVRDGNGEVVKFFSIQSDITELKRIREEIMHQRIAHDQQIARAALKAQEDKQTEIGQELHDNINQILAVAQIYTGMLHNPATPAKEQANLISEHIKMAITEIRKLSHRLVAPRLMNEPLQEMFEPLFELAGDDVKIEKRFNINERVTLPADYRLALYRIAQEQFNNIHKYAGATHVKLLVGISEQVVYMVIEDNGKGFDLSKKRTGIGLTNINHRSRSLNGKAEIQSAPGEGCRLIITLPLEESLETA
jgi:PAS domain S-box-containing protein